MVDVARRAGVSQKTVSRVVNNAPYVRADVRDRVNAVIEELGYRPNVAARALARQRTHTIGMLVVG
ncbi:MAG TPA: LacI family DNA-binding transcriptional regulator, partial [Microlunatus sp.]|nr:LacI family DNA-binding transcriptional regulator [Microlunatus sp.]